MNNQLEREGRQVEYKEQVEDYKSLIRTVVAFLNDIGGRVIIGVKDRSLDIIGLSNVKVDLLLERIPQAIYDAITPACRPQVRALTINGKLLVEVLVNQGHSKPYYVTSLGKDQGTFIRVGAHTKKAGQNIIEDLERQGQGINYDEVGIAPAHTVVLHQALLKELYQNTNPSQEQLLADKVLVLDKLTAETKVSISGVVFFAEEPQKLLPQAEILYTRFASENVTNKFISKDLTGPIEVILDLTLELLKKELAVEQTVEDTKLKTNKLEIPLPALRETMLNALIHRRYDIMDAIKVSIFSNRVEIFNPGNFPGPITDFLSGVSYARNPNLRQLARKKGLVEKRGLGFRTIFNSCKENGNPTPKIEEKELGVQVTLYRQHGQNIKRLPPRLQPLDKLYASGVTFQTSEAAEVLRVNRNTARMWLNELVNQGLLETSGKGRGAYWKWT